MAAPTRALVRRLAAALTLLAALTLGLHKAADPARAVFGDRMAPADLQLQATPDHGEADRGPLDRLAAVQHSWRVCVTARHAPTAVAAMPLSIVVPAGPSPAVSLPDGDPAGPLRPPRSATTV